MTSRSEWDVTTEKGREELERFLMERMGFQRKDGVWAHKDGGHVDESWLFSGDGMVWAKEWAAETYAWDIETLVSKDFARAVVLHADPAYPRQIATSNCEQYAVALALARALEEMDSQAGGDGS